MRILKLAAFAVCTMGSLAQVAVPAQPGVQAPAGGAPGAARPATGIITGRVLAGEGGGPVSAATVTLSTGGSGSRDSPRVLTDAQGRYFFSGLAAGSYNVNVTKPGWLPGAFGRGRPGGATTPVVLAAAQRHGDTDVPLWKSAVITGRVLDSAGDAMVAVDVRIFRLTYGGGRQQPVFVVRARTDDRGVYRFSSLDPGDYIVCVPATVTSEPSGFGGVIRAGSETPRHYLQTMSAVGSAPMTLERSDGFSGTDRWGVSSILSMPGSPPSSGTWLTYPTTYAPAATSRAAATIVRAVSGRERAGVDITVRLVPTFQVSGTVTGPDGPAAYHAVHLIPADSAETPIVDTSTAITDSTGAFTFFGVPAGSYVARVVRTPWPGPSMRLGIAGGTGAIAYVTAFPASSGVPPVPTVPTEPLLHAAQPVSVTDRDLRSVPIVLRAGPRVSGRVQFEGAAAQPAPDVLARLQVALEPVMGQNYSNVQPGLASASGQFTTPSSLAGRYLIRVPNPPAGWTLRSAMVLSHDASETPIDLVTDIDNVVLTFTDKPVSITGNVQPEDPSAAPIATLVLLFPVERDGWVDYGRNSRRVRSAPASRTGAFTMPAPPEGEYFLVAIPDADAIDWQNPLVLERLSAVADRVQVRDGQALTRTLRLRRAQ